MSNPQAVRKLAEADLYGYSKWLAAHLGFPLIPRSLRGFQHGWIWWSPEDADLIPGFGLDPNVNNYWGVLSQNEDISAYLRKRGIFSHACGLPFLNYYKHCGLSGSFKHLKNNRILYVPIHSNPWNNRSGDIEASAKRFADIYQRSSIMLAWNDKHIAPRLDGIFDRVEIGAGALENESFLRLMNIFERYDYMITDSMGSHVCYALECGMKVGIHSHLHSKIDDNKDRLQTVDYKRLKETKALEGHRLVHSLDYIETRYPGIVIDGGLPNYSIVPSNISNTRPDIIAKLLGWDITFESDLVERMQLNGN
jgi:hypothetical protein